MYGVQQDHSGSGGAASSYLGHLYGMVQQVTKECEYQILFSEDNGVTWTDDTARAKAGTGTRLVTGGYELEALAASSALVVVILLLVVLVDRL